MGWERSVPRLFGVANRPWKCFQLDIIAGQGFVKVAWLLIPTCPKGNQAIRLPEGRIQAIESMALRSCCQRPSGLASNRCVRDWGLSLTWWGERGWNIIIKEKFIEGKVVILYYYFKKQHTFNSAAYKCFSRDRVSSIRFIFFRTIKRSPLTIFMYLFKENDSPPHEKLLWIQDKDVNQSNSLQNFPCRCQEDNLLKWYRIILNNRRFI